MRYYIRLVAIAFATVSVVCPPALLAQTQGGQIVTSSANARSARAVQDAKPGLLVGTRSTVFSSIQGNALNSTNQPLPDVAIRLRDARLGRIVATERSDKSGLFVFRSVDPGSYIIELMGENDQVLAASDILNVSSGQSVTAVVKLPFRVSAFEGLFGPSTASAVTVIAAGAAAGVLSVKATTSRSP